MSDSESAKRYRLLDEFRGLFAGQRYRHRDSSRGDWVAMHLYEDLYRMGKSAFLRQRIESQEHVLNVRNRRRGIKARRGDGTFGEIVPGVGAIVDPGFSVARGEVATVEIGSEVKILAKAMIKQIERVTHDLVGQVEHFKRGAGSPICVAIVGINHAARCVGYEGERAHATDGKGHAHPIQECAEAERRLLADAAPAFDEFVVLRYRAVNEEPYPFTWVDYDTTFKDYGAALTRISREYDKRFGPRASN